jgi:hypothetical protein
MRVSVWSHDANPAVDPRLCKQSLPYCESQVAEGWLIWLDPANKALGCRATRRLEPRGQHESREHKMAAGTMMAAWGVTQSGYAGPLVWQMRRERGLEAR